MKDRTLSHYRIVDKLGEGGMGVVYRADDTKLGREVALKILPPNFARDPERVARFEREARLLASLNHPNIAVLYGVERAEDLHFLVMELVPGETLAEHLAVLCRSRRSSSSSSKSRTRSKPRTRKGSSTAT